MNKRAFKNGQTAVLAAFIFANLAEALAIREQFTNEATEGFAHCGAYFAEKTGCEQGKAEGIDWDAIDDVFQYDLLSIQKKFEQESVVTKDVVETVIADSGLPTKTTEVADKIVDEVPELQVFEIGGDDDEENSGYQTTDKSEGGVS